MIPTTLQKALSESASKNDPGDDGSASDAADAFSDLGERSLILETTVLFMKAKLRPLSNFPKTVDDPTGRVKWDLVFKKVFSEKLRSGLKEKCFFSSFLLEEFFDKVLAAMAGDIGSKNTPTNTRMERSFLDTFFTATKGPKSMRLLHLKV